jgi:hypothetical protein
MTWTGQFVVQRRILVLGRLLAGRRHQQFEHPVAPAGLRVVVQLPERGRLRFAQLGRVFGVVPDQHLDPVRVERLDVLGELVAVLELEPLGTTFLHRHGQHEAGLLGRAGHVGAELLVDQDAQPPRDQRGIADHPLGRGEDQHLGRPHVRELLVGRLIILDAEQAAERVALIHRHDEQRLCCGRRSRDFRHGRLLPSAGPVMFIKSSSGPGRCTGRPGGGRGHGKLPKPGKVRCR